ncbi:unnamed protein product [Urochloa humidicola]
MASEAGGGGRPLPPPLPCSLLPPPGRGWRGPVLDPLARRRRVGGFHARRRVDGEQGHRGRGSGDDFNFAPVDEAGDARRAGHLPRASPSHQARRPPPRAPARLLVFFVLLAGQSSQRVASPLLCAVRSGPWTSSLARIAHLLAGSRCDGGGSNSPARGSATWSSTAWGAAGFSAEEVMHEWLEGVRGRWPRAEVAHAARVFRALGVPFLRSARYGTVCDTVSAAARKTPCMLRGAAWRFTERRPVPSAGSLRAPKRWWRAPHPFNALLCLLRCQQPTGRHDQRSKLMLTPASSE